MMKISDRLRIEVKNAWKVRCPNDRLDLNLLEAAIDDLDCWDWEAEPEYWSDTLTDDVFEVLEAMECERMGQADYYRDVA